MSRFRLTLLGSPQLLEDGRPVRLHTRKCMALLSYLALSDHDLSRESLSTLLWPAQDEKHSRASLRRALSSIRGALGSHMLQSIGDMVRLRNDPALAIDVAEYHALVDPCVEPTGNSSKTSACVGQLTEAAKTYQADFLTGFTLPDCPGFDEWQFFVSEGLRNSLGHVLDILIRWHGDRCEYDQAVTYARRRLAHDYLHEPAHRILMELYALSGQYSAAARQYEEWVHVLDEELGVVPDDQTERLYQSIKLRRLPPELLLRRGAKDEASAGVPKGARSVPIAEEGPESNLPSQPTPFVGREEELAEIIGRLRDPECRLLTIVAAGGMGKTRVAIEAARRLLIDVSTDNAFGDGIYFVALQRVGTADELVYAIADALHFTFYRDSPPNTQVLDYLQDKRLLLLLDNFEHLLDGAGLIAEILAAAPRVKILVTSREGLRLRQEWFHPLAGMHFGGGLTKGEPSVSDMDAVRLFAQNAQRSQPHFQLDDELDDVVRICRLVDGMPLGIELAAPWVKALSCAQIADEIDRDLDILTSRNRDILERHRSMRVMLEYSYRLLSDDEQAALERLSIFQGGFMLDAAEKIADTSLMTLFTCVEKSLLQVIEGRRYQMHELLRQYGAEKLAERGAEESRLRDLHASYYCDFVARHYECLEHSQQQHVLGELDAERGNIQLAWERAASQQNLDLIMQAMDGLGLFYQWKGDLMGGQSAFALIGYDTRYALSRKLQQVQAHAQAWTAEFELMSGHPDTAAEHLGHCMETLQILEAAGEDVRWSKALAYLHMGHLERPRNLERAVSAYRRSCDYYEELEWPWNAAIACAWLGETEREIGNTSKAISLLRSAQAVFEEYGDERSVAMVLENIARAYLLDQADLDVALKTGQRSLQLFRQSGDKVGIATTLLVVSYVYCWLNQPLEAKPLMEEALEIAQNLGHKPLECEAYYVATVIHNYFEDKERKREFGERGYSLARKLGDVRLMSNFLRSLGTQVMIDGDIEKAHEMHVKAFEVQEQAGIQVMLPWLHVMRAYSSWRLGYFDEAKTHTEFALKASIRRSDLYTVVHSLLFLAQVIARRGEVERAAEIGSTARAVSNWERSLTGRKVFVEPLLELTKCLPPAIAQAAKRKGQEREVFDLAAALLAEVEAPSWEWI